MPIKSEKLAKFSAIITVNSADVNPASFNFSDSSSLQAKLTQDREASEFLRMDFLMFAEEGLFKEGRDLKKSVGIFNLGQALTHRLSTIRGTMPGDSLFGVPWFNYLGKTYKNKDIVLANLREDILDEVEKDARVGGVLSLNVNLIDPNAISVDISVVPVFTSFSETVNIVLTAGV
jgi:hypothetical protein